MKVFLVNLDRDVEKLRFMTEQLEGLGIPYERVAAVDGRAMSAEEKAQAVNRFRWWCAIGLKPREAEIGCALSHGNIYRRMVSEATLGEAVCILEDDVRLSDEFLQVLADVERWIGNERPQVVMLSDITQQYGEASQQGKREIMRSSFGYCTDAYVLNRRAAEALLSENYPLQRPCDHWAKWVKRGAIELYHYVPTSAWQEQERFGTSTQGGLERVQDYPMMKWCCHKILRLIGKSIDYLLG